MIETLTIQTEGQDLYEITDQLQEIVGRGAQAEGLCTIFLQHTSASLTVQENADPSARRDLAAWLERLVPENDPNFTHTAEGPDDMPSHIKAALTAASLSIPIVGGRMALGTWQGVYLWEHRRRPHQRRLIIHIPD